MKTKAFLFMIAGAVFLLCGSTKAVALNVDGQWSDWGISLVNGTATNQTPSDLVPDAGISYFVEDTRDDKNGYQVGPGYGGQNFDFEAIMATIVDDYLYFAVVSGMRPDNGSRVYEPGDIVITTTNQTYALETTGFRYDLDSHGYVKETPVNGVAGGLYAVDGNYSDGDSGNTLLMDGLSNWAETSDNVDPVQLYSVGSSLATCDFWFNNDFDGPGDAHSFMEGRIDLALLDGTPTEVHSAHSCGNDGGTVAVAPVPEPATILLFGAGLLGFAGLGRKRLLKRS